jgi:NADH dehydrogenase
MNIFLTGASGFVGGEILKKLLEKGYNVYALVRDEKRLDISHKNLTPVIGDILNIDTYESFLAKCDAIVNLVGIIREYKKRGITFYRLHFEATKNLVDLAKKLHIKRFIQMSANGTRENAVSNYHKTKYLAEDYLIKSGLDYTIFRPSAIYGPRDEFINMLNSIMKKTPVFIYFGDGGYKMQPVSVYEVAELFVNAIENKNSVKKIYPVCGSKILTYKELLKLIIKTTNKKVLLFPTPEFFVSIFVKIFGDTTFTPITRDQFIMLKEGNICDNDTCFTELNVKKLNIEEVLKTYLK